MLLWYLQCAEGKLQTNVLVFHQQLYLSKTKRNNAPITAPNITYSTQASFVQTLLNVMVLQCILLNFNHFLTGTLAQKVGSVNMRCTATDRRPCSNFTKKLAIIPKWCGPLLIKLVVGWSTARVVHGETITSIFAITVPGKCYFFLFL